MTKFAAPLAVYAFVVSLAGALNNGTPYSPTLSKTIQWLLAGGVGVIASWFMERAQEKWPQLADLRPDVKSYIAMGACAIMGMLLFLIQVWASYAPLPIGGVQWIEALFASAAMAAGLNKITHSIMVLRHK